MAVKRRSSDLCADPSIENRRISTANVISAGCRPPGSPLPRTVPAASAAGEIMRCRHVGGAALRYRLYHRARAAAAIVDESGMRLPFPRAAY